MVGLTALGGLSQGQGASLGGGTSGVDSTISTATGQKTFNTGPSAGAGSGSELWMIGGVMVAGLLAIALMARR